MKLLVDPAQQRGCLRKARGGDGAGGGDDLPDEFKWWAGKSSVHEMEQAFRNLEEYLDAKGAFGERVDDNLWVEPRDAADCVFVDARDVMAYDVLDLCRFLRAVCDLQRPQRRSHQ